MIFSPEVLVTGFVALEGRILCKQQGVAVPDYFELMELSGRYDRNPPSRLFEFSARRLRALRENREDDFTEEEVMSDVFGAYQTAQHYAHSVLLGIPIMIAYSDVSQMNVVRLEKDNLLSQFVQIDLLMKLAHGMCPEFSVRNDELFFPLRGVREYALEQYQATGRILRQYAPLMSDVEMIMCTPSRFDEGFRDE